MRAEIERQVYTTPELAEIWGVAPEKIIAWIKSGELRAANLAKSRRNRPRFSIAKSDAEAFWLSRQVIPASTGVGRIRRKSAPGVTEFF